MRILKYVYEKCNKRSAPYFLEYSLGTILMKPIRKWLTNSVAANCPFNCIRVFIYRMCGFEIGRHTFIGMRCYLDDMCYDLLTIGNNCTISYGVYFACHGKNQKHYPIKVEDGAYIGMRASIISNNADHKVDGVTIGKRAVVGACALVNRNIPADCTARGVPCIILYPKEKTEDTTEAKVEVT